MFTASHICCGCAQYALFGENATLERRDRTVPAAAVATSDATRSRTTVLNGGQSYQLLSNTRAHANTTMYSQLTQSRKQTNLRSVNV